MKYLYKYPQAEFPYQDLIDENARRTREDKEYQLIDTGVFDEDRYFDIEIEVCKETPDELLCRVTAWNRGPDPAPLHIIPQMWFRNTWSWGGRNGREEKPSISMNADGVITSKHHSLGDRYLLLAPSPGVGNTEDVFPEMLFTDNDTNFEGLYGGENNTPYVKDAFHRYIVDGEKDAVNPAQTGTKSASWFAFNEAGGVPPGDCAGRRETSQQAWDA